MKPRTPSLFALLVASTGCLASAQEIAAIEEVVVIGSRTEANKIAGSGTLIDSEELERFDQIDLNQVLAAVPGLYIREEDGYGLRPNIGIRGAAAERSQKITLMEDGVLIAPAPYSAPAAYYVPNVSRIDAIEVLKGPAAIRYGPHTVGGAVNFVTRSVPIERTAEVDLSAGSDAFYKVQGVLGKNWGDFGVLVDGLRYASDGFKELDGGGDTGFIRNDVGAKLRWQASGDRYQSLTVKLGFGDEDADETYLGLTDSDFDNDPKRRYAASQLARFQSEHKKIHVNYGLGVTKNIHVNAKLYWNDFERSWNKVDGFIDGPTLQSVLASPSSFALEYGLITGNLNSDDSDSQRIEVTNNNRNFESRGAQLTATWQGQLGDISHETVAGIRFHNDEVIRDHMPRAYRMSGGQLVWDGLARPPKVRNKAKTDAWAFYLSESLTWNRLTLNLGVRHENIKSDLEDFNADVTRSGSQSFTSPGVGIFWQLTDSIGLLAGVYRGYSPAGPGNDEVDPEKSINYEYGARLSTDNMRMEVVGFFSDYKNLLGRCRVSDAACVAGQEFNGGGVEVAGLEVTGTARIPISMGLALTADLTYTYTESAFQSTFLSQFSQWRLVKRGDELPYLPRHVGQLRVGLFSPRWDVTAVIKFQEKMREEPGRGPTSNGLHTDGYITMDLVGTWNLSEATSLQLITQNITDEAAIVSHRPFGARPNRPRSLIGRIKHRF